MKSKSVIGIMIAVCTALILCFTVPAMAASNSAAGAASSNLGDHNYTYDRWATPIHSYLIPNADGTLTRVEAIGQQVVVESYDAAHNLINGFSIEGELPLFGGFYAGTTHNFLVFGQENPTEDDAVEVIRVVCYTKDWTRVGAASLFGANTTVPFDAGSLRFAECDGYLYIRTAHEMYASNDGVNHQANVMLNIRISDMTVTDSFTRVMNVNYGYVSHSFNQFLAIDGKDLLAVDHGDAHPRSVVLFKYNAPAGQDSFMQVAYLPVEGGYRYAYVDYVDVLPIAGATGANDTGVSLGGFEVSDTAYLIVGTTVSHEGDYDLFGQRNIFITVTDKDDFSQEGTVVRYLTEYSKDAGVILGNPHFVKVSTDCYAVLWTEQVNNVSTLRYCFVDGQGRLIGQVYTAAGMLSDCKPVVSGNKLVWYATNASFPAFFSIDLDAPENVTHDHIYVYDYEAYPSYHYNGALSSTCGVCGEEGPAVVIPAIMNAEHYTLMEYRQEPTCTTDGSGWFMWKDANSYSVTNYYFSAPIKALGHTMSEATCTAPATCSVCGATEGEALGHSYESVVTAPTCTASGYTTYTCATCGDSYVESYTDPTGHTWTDGVCDCGAYALQHVGATLTLESEVKYNLYFYLNDDSIDISKVGLLTFLTLPENATIDNASFVLSDMFYDTRLGYNAMQTQGIPAKMMGDSLYLRLYAQLEDGTIVYGKVIEYSAKTYATNVLAKPGNTDLKNTLIAMLNYGAAAQELFGYKTDSLMNADLTAEQQATQPGYSADLLNGLVVADPSKTGSLIATEGAITQKSAGVTLTGALQLQFFFLPGKTVDNGEMMLYYWTTSTYNSVDELTLENADGSMAMAMNGSFYQGTVSGIAAKDLDKTVYVLAVFESDGETCMSGITSYSIEQYCRKQVASGTKNQAMCEALTIYSYFTKVYFKVDQA